MTTQKLELKCMKTKSRKSKILFTLASVLVIGSGALIGLMLGQKYFALDYSGIDIEIDEKDDELYQKFLSLKNKNVQPSRYLSEFRPYQLVKLGLMNFEKEPYAQITNKGTVNASVTNQTICSKYIKYNDSYFAESLSSGLMKIGWRFYQTKENEIKVYKSSGLKDSESAQWPNTPKDVFTTSTFKETWGKSMTMPFIYTLNHLTVDKENETSKIDGDNIIVDLTLEPQLSTINYGKQMKETSGLSGVPNFSSVTLQLTLTHDLMIIRNDISEKYNTPYHGLPVSTKGTITENYTYLENISIPSLSEDVDYK